MNNGRKLYVLDAKKQQVLTAAAIWRESLNDALKSKEFFSVAFSGGRTPEKLFQRLVLEESIKWDRVHVFFCDERFVPYDDDLSNFKMIKENLFSKVDIPESNIHSVPVNEKNHWQAAQKYEEFLIKFFNVKGKQFPMLDLVMLGIGEDGHTASLFPGTDALREEDRTVIAVNTEAKKPRERISLTLPVLRNAKRILFLVSGRDKADVLKRIIEQGDTTLPAGAVAAGLDNVYYLLDAEAASGLSKKVPVKEI